MNQVLTFNLVGGSLNVIFWWVKTFGMVMFLSLKLCCCRLFMRVNHHYRQKPIHTQFTVPESLYERKTNCVTFKKAFSNLLGLF